MILKILKEQTRAQHEEVEAAVDVMNQMFDLDAYKRLVGGFWSFYAAYEPLIPIEELRAAGFDYAERVKLPLLERDARALGLELEACNAQMPDLGSAAKAFGSLYVIEGSTLGGQVISRHLKETLAITPENGGEFYAGYGKETGPMWKAFGESITAFADGKSLDDEIVDSAKATFAVITEWVGRKTSAAATIK
ncbi:MAG: heme oxygenase [Acidobacteria bacterium OLB17]|nr:MAG: heme oxygenase [Acidobacteria bacterium OLB17]MCZ2391841.1 biliverdin-producing heme oxygenase [Acidobacteriota bacterium]